MKYILFLFVSLPCFAQDSVKVLPVKTYLMLVDRAWYWNAARDTVILQQDSVIATLQMVMDSTRYNHRQEVGALRGALFQSEKVTAGQMKLTQHWRGEARKSRRGNRLLKIAVPAALVFGFWAGSR